MAWVTMDSVAIIMSISVLPVFVLVKEVLQHPLERLERWPLLMACLPAVEHDLVELVRTVGRLWHSVRSRHLLENLLVAHAWIGCASVCNYFCQNNAERPHVRFNTEFVENGCFGCRPFYRKFCALKKKKKQRISSNSIWRRFYSEMDRLIRDV